MELHDLRPAPGAKKNRKRIGRGTASGTGTTAGKGNKGQKARAGKGKTVPGFEGGQMPLIRRLPKRGFRNTMFQKTFEIVNLDQIESRFNEGDNVNADTLVEKNLIKGNKDGVKVLGNGQISKKLSFQVTSVSKSAVEKIKSAGGEIADLG